MNTTNMEARVSSVRNTQESIKNYTSGSFSLQSGRSQWSQVSYGRPVFFCGHETRNFWYIHSDKVCSCADQLKFSVQNPTRYENSKSEWCSSRKHEKYKTLRLTEKLTTDVTFWIHYLLRKLTNWKIFNSKSDTLKLLFFQKVNLSWFFRF